ncbi:MAG: mechanosensitive ion channel family protein [Chromatiaceae bacterium]|nr:MAG: mechanosensitive ion channel family protein [Chromatiaceae bacterium]
MPEEHEVARLFRPLDAVAMGEIAAILGVALLLILFEQHLLPWFANRLKGQVRLYLLAIVPVLRLLIIVGALVLVVPRIIEPSLQNMVALFGTVGLAIGFALKDYASSLIAGVVSVLEMPYRTGDWIEIGGTYGEVTHIGMRTVRLVTRDDNVVTIPHQKLWNDAIVNANDGGQDLQCVAHFFVHPDHDGSALQQALHDVALTSPYLQLRLPVTVGAAELPWATRYSIRAYPLDPRQQFRFVTDLTLRGKTALTRLGVPPAAATVAAAAD